MQHQVEVRSFEAVDRFRAAVIGFIEAANAALGSAEAEIRRTITWLETEQMPHWKAMLRTTAQEVEDAKRAYREKALYKDSTGKRHSAIDELRALRRAEQKRNEVEKRATATRRNLRQLQRDLTLYQSGVQQLRGAVNGRLMLGVEELRRVVEQLERYARVAPEVSPPPGQDDVMGRPPAIGASTPGTLLEEEGDAALNEGLRRRTPGPQARSRAARAEVIPPLPVVPEEAIEAVLPQLQHETPGRYDLVTSTLSPDDASGAAYLERRDPAGPHDTGWHIGPAAPDAARTGPCVTMTVGRLEAQRPDLARLLSLPTGSFLRSSDGRLEMVVDPVGRILWRAETVDEPVVKGEG